MALSVGRRLGPYEIVAPLGAGGMGEVYRARDSKLNREVALKILPEQFALDADRLARFKREAQVLASLNHPNIAIIHGLEESDGVRALVLELVEGPTLADRIAKGPVPLEEALPIAKQIADALEAAHEHGVIHRDLKPANVKVRPDGTVKVLDFGLAKSMEPATSSLPSVTQSPTITTPAMTQAGMILGTAAYMSPEQAKGREADKRSDVWAFGCVLYEMLAGTRAFRGETVSETLADVMKSEPPWTALPRETPAALQNILRRCLKKDPRQRVRDIGDVRLGLEDAFESAAAVETTAVVVPRLRLWQRRVLLVAAGVTLIVATGFAVRALTRPAPPRVTRLTVTPSGATALGPGFIALSPDGTRLAYVGSGGQIVVRTFDQLEPTAVLDVGMVGTTGSLFFSPDGQWIGFSDNIARLKKVATTGGPPTTVTGITAGLLGASWGTDDTIIFATSNAYSGLLRVAATGGEPEALTTPNRAQGEVFHAWPEVLPGGHALLFTITPMGGVDNNQIAVLDLRTRAQKVLIRGGSHARYVPTGHLVYGVAGTLRAVAFDLNRLEVVGAPIPVLEQVMTTAGGDVNMSLSSDGTLVYVGGGQQAALGTLVWVDRQGREEALKAPPHGYSQPRLSPDGARLALTFNGDIWIWDLARETLTRFTFDPSNDQYPVWTPDGRRLAFRSQRNGGPYNLFWQAADGTGAVERLTESPNEQAAYAFWLEGKRLLIREDRPTTGADLALLTLEGERRVEPLLHTTFHERNGEISPDGRWLAYQSDESGQFEIYVRPFPDVASGRWQISTGGGTTPLWPRSGRELFYRAPGGAVMSVSVEGGSTFTAARPSKLFEGPYLLAPGRTYNVSPNGQRFLMIKNRDSVPTSIVVVLNWLEELKRLVPTNR